MAWKFARLPLLSWALGWVGKYVVLGNGRAGSAGVVVGGDVGSDSGSGGDSERGDNKIARVSPVCPACKMDITKPTGADEARLSICVYCHVAMRLEKKELKILSAKEWEDLEPRVKEAFLRTTAMPNPQVAQTRQRVLMMKLREGLKDGNKR